MTQGISIKCVQGVDKENPQKAENKLDMSMELGRLFVQIAVMYNAELTGRGPKELRGRLMKIFVTEMLRWGDSETHHYIVGAFSAKEVAEYAGEVEKTWRGGKYDARIIECEVDRELEQDKLDFYLACMPNVEITGRGTKNDGNA